MDFLRELILPIFATTQTVQLLSETFFRICHIFRDIRSITFEIKHPVRINRASGKRMPNVLGQFFIRRFPSLSKTIRYVQRVNVNGQVLSIVTRTTPSGLAIMAPKRRNNVVLRWYTNGRLHEEIRPQSSTGFITLTWSFCLHKHERERTTGAYTRSRSSNESPIKPPQRCVVRLPTFHQEDIN